MLKAILQRAVDALIAHAMRTPYRHLGGYMHRYWLVQPSGWTLGLGVRVHHILRSDRDQDMHTHPWWFISVILRGEYWEVTPAKGGRFRGLPGAYANVNEPFQVSKRKAGGIAFRPRSSRHKVILLGGTVWTLVITGRDHDLWGYMVDGDMYVDRHEYHQSRGDA